MKRANMLGMRLTLLLSESITRIREASNERASERASRTIIRDPRLSNRALYVQVEQMLSLSHRHPLPRHANTGFSSTYRIRKFNVLKVKKSGLDLGKRMFVEV